MEQRLLRGSRHGLRQQALGALLLTAKVMNPAQGIDKKGLIRFFETQRDGARFGQPLLVGTVPGKQGREIVGREIQRRDLLENFPVKPLRALRIPASLHAFGQQQFEVER
ncbi:MAG: hypothetical protein IPJ33_04305, partial [Gammaproteobacteria bacterium]|nr:hypothetical protein [Gammaproteobacteria bacterium]